MKDELLALLYSAVNSTYGIVVETDATEPLRQKLYGLRKEYAPEFEKLSFLVSPINGADLWILNKDQSNAEE